ncbi:hypothetical protein [Okeania sp. SIO2B3]|uniref:hypothetical protein n=1 Tax=Okeania sp. SIO2B3 TaxID=2607784 RepID=UPI0013C1F496|nr:hypothetical protein [Okeania sp. SIO2B3]NET40610.1 hypothetical protein [Okeania sp. SIO2B3]
MNNIWAENLERNKKAIDSSEARVVKVLERIKWVNPEMHKKHEAIYCGYFLEGEPLLEDQRLIYSSELGFKVVEARDIVAFQKCDTSKGEENLELISKTVSQPKVRKKGKFSREDTRDQYTEYCDPSNPIALQLEELICNLTTISNPEIVMPVLISTLMIPSALCSNYLITVFWGKSGTGKSSALRLASEMYDCPTLSSTATYAGIRNHIESCRISVDDNGEESEENIIICIDDCSENTFKEEKIYTLLKTGTSISNAKTAISSAETGKNQSFNSACPKAVSTCDPFWTLPEFHEIRRRIIIIPTEKENRDFVDKEMLVFNEGSDFPLADVIRNFWLEKQKEFKILLKRLRGEEKELIASMAVVYDMEIPAAKDKVKEYRKYIKSILFKPDPKHSYINQYLERKEAEAMRTNEKRKKDGDELLVAVIIPAATIRQEFKQGVENGVFDSINTQTISQIMREKCYELKNLSGSWYWVKPFA